MKPHVIPYLTSYGQRRWMCGGLGAAGFGDTPSEAYRQWLEVRS